MEARFLYRGVSLEMHNQSNGVLSPKGTSFEGISHFDQGFHFDQGLTFDESEENAVVEHQRNSNCYPTSGVSTTPHWDRAKKYATRNGTQDGIVYKLDRSKFPKYGIKEYVVKDYTNFPHIPEDDEVILVHEDHGNLPKDIIVEIIEVNL